MTADLPLVKNVFAPLAKNVLLPYRLSEGMLEADTTNQKEIYGSDRSSDLDLRTTALIVLNEELEDIMKIIKS